MPSKENRRYWPTRWQIPLGKQAGGSYAATATPAVLDPSDALQPSGITHRAVLYPATIGGCGRRKTGFYARTSKLKATDR